MSARGWSLPRDEIPCCPLQGRCLVKARLPATLITGSTLDDTDGTHAGDFARDAGLMHDLDDVVDVLVCLRLLLRQALAALGPGDDAAGLQLLVDAASGGVLDRGGAAHRPA